MSNPRAAGLALLLIGVLVLMGNTLDVLPPEAFFAGLLTYPIGGYLFFMGSRHAIANKAEVRTARKFERRLGNAAGEEHARRQGSQVVNPNAPRAVGEAEAHGPTAADPNQLVLNEIDMSSDGSNDGDDGEQAFQVGTDVSYPVELQESGKLADQLEKLSKLQEQGIISAEELAVAKAKLLG